MNNWENEERLSIWFKSTISRKTGTTHNGAYANTSKLAYSLIPARRKFECAHALSNFFLALQEHKIECEENSGKEANKQEHCSCDMERIGEHYGVRKPILISQCHVDSSILHDEYHRNNIIGNAPISCILPPILRTVLHNSLALKRPMFLVW